MSIRTSGGKRSGGMRDSDMDSLSASASEVLLF